MLILVEKSVHIGKSYTFTGVKTQYIKETKSVTMNIFRFFFFFFFFFYKKSFAKVELSYVFSIKMLSTAENFMEK